MEVGGGSEDLALMCEKDEMGCGSAAVLEKGKGRPAELKGEGRKAGTQSK